MVASCDGRLFVLYRASVDNGRLEVCSTDGWTWVKAERIGRGESVRVSTQPSAVAFRGRLHVFYRGESAAGTLFTVSTANGREWVGPVNLTEATRGARVVAAPFAVVFDGRLVVLMRDPVSSRIMLCHSSDGVNWSAAETVAGTESEERPVAVVHDSRLFVFFQGNGGVVCVVSCSRNGGWADHGAIPRAVEWPPVPVVLGERLVLLVRDYLEPRWMGATDTQGGTDWVAQPMSLDDVASTPAVVVRGHHATVVYRDLQGAVNAVELLAPDSWGARVADVASAVHEVVDGEQVARYRDRSLVCERRSSKVRVVGGDDHRVGEDGVPVKPGTCQVLGDYLALAGSECGEDGLVRFFDLRPIARGGAAIPVPTTVDAHGRAVAAGITTVSSGSDRRYVLGVHDGRQVTILESTPAPLWSPECRFAPLFSAPVGGSAGIALLTDKAGDVHLLSQARGGWVRHHRVDFAAEALRAAGEYPASPTAKPGDLTTPLPPR